MSRKRILLAAHLFYADKVERIFNCIDNVKTTCDVDLYVSGSPSLVKVARERYPQCNITETQNIGYDIWPFIKVLNLVDLSKYDYVVKVHTKRDMPRGHRLPTVDTEGSAWGDFLLSFIEKKDEWKKSLQLMQDSDAGMIADYHICIRGRDDPREKLQPVIAEIFRRISDLQYRNFFFPAGTMFIARAECFLPIQGRFSFANFADESGDHDDGFSHAVERILGFVIYACGKEIYTNDNKKISDIYKECFIDKIVQKKMTRHHTIYKVFGVPVASIKRIRTRTTSERGSVDRKF